MTYRMLVLLVSLLAAGRSPGWDYEGHRLVNRLGLACLPTNFPAFIRTPEAEERIAFLAGEADRWRNTPDLPLKHANSPDHFIDLEDLAPHGLSLSNLSHFRYEFAAQLFLGRARHSTNFTKINRTNDTDRTKALVGFLPWAITENYAKLKSAFSYLKALEEAGSPQEIRNAQENVIYVMGVMGHFVGDAAQPLHTTRHFNGWTGPNTNLFTTNRTFHGWIDGGYLQKVGISYHELLPRLRPATMLWPGHPRGKHEDIFPETFQFIIDQHALVIPLYEMDKEGKLSGEGEMGKRGKAFLSSQLVKAGQLLGRMWYSAWQQAGPDVYLIGQLRKRQALNQTNPVATPP